jgi:hypothetical protein
MKSAALFFEKNRERAIEIILFVTLMVSYAYFLPKWADWSQNSRMDLTLAIVDQGTLAIDDYYENTGDYAFFEGHYYLDKAPGPVFLAVPVYAAVRPILNSAPVQHALERLASKPAFADTLNAEGTGLLVEKIYFAIALYIVTVVVVALPSAFLGVLIYRFLRQLGASPAWSAAAVLIYGLATNAFPYSSNFYSHQLVAVLLFGAFYIGVQIKRGTLSPKWVVAAGLMLGFALISEYPSALIAGAVFLYTVLALPQRRWIGAYVLAGLMPGLLLMAYDYAIFHTVLPVGYKYSELYTDLHSIGFLSLTYPTVEGMWGITFGSFRGLFYVSPVLLLALAGLAAWPRLGRMRAEWLVCAWAAASFFLFNASSAMWNGGFAIGPRYLVPMLPFLAVGLGVFGMRWGRSAWGRGLAAFLTVWSVLVTWVELLGGQIFPDWTPNPLFNFSIPNLLAGNVARSLGMALGLRGLVSVLPLLVFIFLMVLLLGRQILAFRSEPIWNKAQSMPALGEKSL